MRQMSDKSTTIHRRNGCHHQRSSSSTATTSPPIYLPRLREFFGARRITRHKFKAYMGKQHVWNVVAQRLAGDRAAQRNFVIAMGNAKFQHNSPGGPSSPLRRMVKELRRRCMVRMIDVFRTSITCSKCDDELPKKTRLWQVCNNIFLIHASDYLDSSFQISHTYISAKRQWNRDVNAARNMRSIFLDMNSHNGERPYAFQRTPA
ncbi:hypothetical protein BC832DRAFT_430388 [Gaertneriomyces semiglobifer]|nr:hypothetical protein BC832DRAFT_430388 [Gaertneriomyces semiglobifer]